MSFAHVSVIKASIAFAKCVVMDEESPAPPPKPASTHLAHALTMVEGRERRRGVYLASSGTTFPSSRNWANQL